MASISCQHIYKIYPGATAPSVTDFNLEIQDKEFIIFVGPSGCGKSTTLRMIAGLEEISKGEMYIGGRLINDVPPKDRDIAMVWDQYTEPRVTAYAVDSVRRWRELRQIDRTAGRPAVVLESLVRIRDRHPDAAVIGNLTGPISLAASLVDAAVFYKELRKLPAVRSPHAARLPSSDLPPRRQNPPRPP